MSEFAFDVSIEEFEAKVLIPAETVPVVVDFWAPWCEPCKVLKPMLEKLAEEYKGRFLLAKVNSDENPELAQHFGVRNGLACIAAGGIALTIAMVWGTPLRSVRT